MKSGMTTQHVPGNTSRVRVQAAFDRRQLRDHRRVADFAEARNLSVLPHSQFEEHGLWA